MAESMDKPASRFEIAVIGAGPSGFYAADALLRSELPVAVDVYERLPAPFGLVRYGVAPDHPRLKSTIKVFEKIAQDPRFGFIGNVDVGSDITLQELRRHYDVVILAHGTRRGRALDIPGGDLNGCHTASDFVGWYNGHPDFMNLRFDLSARSVAIVGNGNVALDLARILLQPIDALRQTDIATHALEVLAESSVRDVHLIGRRGPAQAAFTNMELRELGQLPGVNPTVDAAQLELTDATETELADRKRFLICKNIETLRSYSERNEVESERRIIFHFLRSPIQAHGSGRIEELHLAVNRLEGKPFEQRAVATEETEVIPCGLLFSSIGYQGEPLTELPFDDYSGTYRNNQGKVAGEPELFTAGWIKRGPSGIIGTNKACSQETVGQVVQYLNGSVGPGSKKGFSGVRQLLESKFVNFDTWSLLDALEISAGMKLGKPREKILNFPKAIASLHNRPSSR